MALGLVLWAGATALVAAAVLQLAGFWRHWTAARRCGLPLVLIPASPLFLPWMLVQSLLLPPLRHLPAAWTAAWLPWMDIAALWRRGHDPFAYAGADTVLAVSPQRNVLWTCDPAVNHQLITRRADFPKPTEVYGPLNSLGPTLPGTEGEEWRVLRRVTARSFHEATNRLVWSYTRDRCQLLLRSWQRSDRVTALHPDLARMTFHVISHVCFGKELTWPDSDRREPLPAGHALSYTDALSAVFLYAPILFLTPRWLLNVSPVPTHRKAHQALTEWFRYVDEMHADKLQDLEHSDPEPNLLGALVEASAPSANGGLAAISPDALTGNIFVFHAAGYETTGSTLAFAMALLACKPAVQAELQSELDRVLGHADMSYDHFPVLWKGFTGAVIQETLRLFPVLSWMPKCTRTPQPLVVDGQSYTLPAGTYIFTATDATHRNPRHWDVPHVPDSFGTFDPVHDFQPRRWLDGFRPAPGAFVPFWEGGRACIGQRFAQVEMCATFATVFRTYTLQLHGADWDQAYARAVHTLRTKTFFSMNLQLREEIPLQLVARRADVDAE